MNIVRNIVVVLIAVVAGSLLNIGTLLIGNVVVPLPEGTDPMDPVSLAAAIPSFTTGHYIFPFLAHALGTFLGAWIAAKFCTSRALLFAMGIGAWFLFGGALNAITLPAALWFEIGDLIFAYLPIAWLAWRLAKRD